MKKFFIVGLLVLASVAQVVAQRAELMVGLGLQGFRSGGFNRFVSSYENYYSSTIDGSFSSLGLPVCSEIGVSYYIERDSKIGFALYFSQQTRGYEIGFKSGARREIHYNVYTPLDFGLIIGNPQSKFRFTTRFGVMDASIVSSYFYKDGSQSFNNVSRLNGVYTSFGFFYKMNAEYRVWKGLHLMAGIGGGSGNNEFQDKSWARDFAYGMILFPTDLEAYEKAVNAGNSYDYPDDERLKPSYFQWYAGATYRINLF